MYSMRLFFNFFTIFFCFYYQLQAQIKITGQEAINEIKELEQIIIDYHPEPFRYISQSNWETKVRQAVDSLTTFQSIKVIDFYRLMMPLINCLRDEHLAAYLNDPDWNQICKEELFFPFQVQNNFEENVFVIQKAFREDLNNLVGKKIIEINGYSYAEIIDLAKQCWTASASSDYQGTLYHTFNHDNFGRFFKLCVDQAQSFRVKFLEGIVLDLKGYPLDKGDRGVITFNTESEPKLHISEDNTLAVLRITAFMPTTYGMSLKKSQKQYDSFFNELKQKKINLLSIDLRGNRGGATYLSTYLASFFYTHPYQPFENIYVKQKSTEDFSAMFKGYYQVNTSNDKNKQVSLMKLKLRFEEKKDNFSPYTGDVAIILDDGVGSAATIFTALMQNYPKLKLYGTETLGDCCTTTGGQYKTVVLPYSKINVLLPLHIFKYQNTSEGKFGIKPKIKKIPDELIISKKEQKK